MDSDMMDTDDTQTIGSRSQTQTPTPQQPMNPAAYNFYQQQVHMTSERLPILCWLVSLNREYTKEEYDACYNHIREYSGQPALTYNPHDPDSFRHLITSILPMLMMRHRRVSRSKWRDLVNPDGKHWIEQDDMPPEKLVLMTIGYHLTFCGSICGMAMVQGPRRKVITIGLGITKVDIEPRGVPVQAWAESLAHKLTPRERSYFPPGTEDSVVVHRIQLLLAIKESYVKAIGQPFGFDFSRLEFDIPNERAMADGHALQGWEFRIFRSRLGVARRDKLVEEQYQCVVAFFRGTTQTKFVWYKNAKELESWVQFLNIDQMVKILPKLTA